MSRSYARVSVFKLVFEYLFNEEKDSILLEEILSEDANKAENSYINDVYNGVISHMNELKKAIAKYADGFSLERMYKVDLAILLVAIYEMKYLSSVPKSVSINEAINIAKQYSTEKSSKYINGILSNFVGE